MLIYTHISVPSSSSSSFTSSFTSSSSSSSWDFFPNAAGVDTENIDLGFRFRLRLSPGRSCLPWRTLSESSPPAAIHPRYIIVFKAADVFVIFSYLIAESALPPAGGVAFFADDDDVLVFENRQQIIVGRAVIGHHLGGVELVLPRDLQHSVQPRRKRCR